MNTDVMKVIGPMELEHECQRASDSSSPGAGYGGRLSPERLRELTQFARQILPGVELVALFGPRGHPWWIVSVEALDERVADRLRSLPDLCRRVEWVDCLRQLLAVPVKRGAAAMGVLLVSCQRLPGEELFATALRAARALEPVLSRLREEIGDAVAESGVGVDTGPDSESTLRLETLLSIPSDRQSMSSKGQLGALLKVAAEHIGAAFGALSLPEKRVDITCGSPAAAGVDTERLYRKVQVHLMRSIMRRAEPLIINKVPAGYDGPLHKFLVVPVRRPGLEPIGFVAFLSPLAGPDFDQRRLYLAQHVAREVVRVGESRRDPATDLLSGVAMEEEVQRTLGSHPAGAHHTVAYLDVDGLRTVNEQLGFEAGDELIERVAGALRAPVLPARAIAGRLKGDRFAVFLPELDPAESLQRMWLLQDEIALIRLRQDSRHLRVSVSCGIAMLPQLPATEAFSCALMAAELACRAAKEQGGSCIEIYSGIDEDMICRSKDVVKVIRLRAALMGKS